MVSVDVILAVGVSTDGQREEHRLGEADLVGQPLRQTAEFYRSVHDPEMS